MLTTLGLVAQNLETLNFHFFETSTKNAQTKHSPTKLEQRPSCPQAALDAEWCFFLSL